MSAEIIPIRIEARMLSLEPDSPAWMKRRLEYLIDSGRLREAFDLCQESKGRVVCSAKSAVPKFRRTS